LSLTAQRRQGLGSK